MSHYFRDTDSPKTIYGNSEKLCHMRSVTMMIQQPYMGYYRELSCHTRTCKVRMMFVFIVYTRKMMIQ